MEYKVVPYSAFISRDDSSETVSKEVQSIIDSGVANGWEFVSMETIETSIAPTSGCFGFGAKPGFSIPFHVLIFKKP